MTGVQTCALSISLVSWYKFDGDITDEEGNNTATNTGATLTTGVLGITDTAYSFDGGGDYKIGRASCRERV